MAYAGEMRWKVSYDVEQAGLTKLKSSLSDIQKLTVFDLKIDDTAQAEKKLAQIRESAKSLETALSKAFNVNLGTINLSKFNQELKQLDIDRISRDFSDAGVAGQAALRNLATSVLTTNVQLKEELGWLTKIKQTLKNTLSWSLASGAIHKMTGEIQSAYQFVKDLDTSLNDIRIVTNKSAEEMDRFAESANNAAKALGRSTTDYTKAALIYYQQGLGEEEVQARTDITLKTANVTGQSAEAVSEELTAIWNGQKVSASEAELYIDKLAAVAATTASDLEELSTGMSKVASAAQATGVDIDQLTAQMATIVSVTRQAPENVGTALKTLYARMSQLQLGETDEDGVTLGQYTEAMANMGIQVLDTKGELRDLGKIMEDVANKWQLLGEAQKMALAQQIGGTRQYNYVYSLMENWDMYTEALDTARNAEGTLEEQNAIYLDSLNSKLKQLKAATEGLYGNLIDDDALKNIVTVLTSLVTSFDEFVQSIGGMGGVLRTAGSIALQVFSKDIANSIMVVIGNVQRAIQVTKDYNAQIALLQQFGSMSNISGGEAGLQTILDLKKQELEIQRNLTAEQVAGVNTQIQAVNQAYAHKDAIAQEAAELAKGYQELTGLSLIPNVETLNNDEILQRLMGFTPEQATQAIREVQNKVKTQTEDFQAAMKIRPLQIDETDSQKILDQADSLSKAEIAARALKDTNAVSDQSQEDLSAALSAYEKVMDKVRRAEQLNTEDKRALNKLLQEVQSNISALSNKEKDFTNSLNKIGNAGTVAFDNISDATNRAQQGINNLQLENTIAQWTGLAGAIGGAASALNALGNIGTVWERFKNDDISIGEALTQTIMPLSFALPQLIKLETQLNDVLGMQGGLFTNLIAGIKILTTARAEQKIADEAATAASIARTTAETAYAKASYKFKKTELNQYAESIIAKFANKEATEEEIKAEIEKQLVDNNETKNIELKTEAIWKEIQARTAEEEAAKKAAKANSIKNLLNPATLGVTIATAALIATFVTVTTVLDNQIKKQQELAKQYAETAQAAADEAKALREEKQALEDNFKTYEDLAAKQDGSAEAKQGLVDASNDLLDVLNKEDVLIAKITGDYSKLNKQVDENRKQNLKDAANAIEEEQDNLFAVLAGTTASQTQTFWEGLFKANQTMITPSENKESGELTGANIFFGRGLGGDKAAKNLLANYDWSQSQYLDFVQRRVAFRLDTNASAEETVQAYTELQNVLNQLTKNGEGNSDYANNIRTYLASIQDTLDSLSDNVVAERKNSLAQTVEGIDFSNVTSTQDQLDKLQQVTKDVSGEQTEKEILDAILASTDNVSEYVAKAGLINSLTINEETKKQLLNVIDDISSEGLALIPHINVDKAWAEESMSDIVKLLNDAGQAETIKIKIDLVDSAIEDLQNGKALSDETMAQLQKVLGDSIDWQTFGKESATKRIQMLAAATADLAQKTNAAQEGQIGLNKAIKDTKLSEEDLKALKDRAGELDASIASIPQEHVGAKAKLQAELEEIRAQIEAAELQVEITPIADSNFEAYVKSIETQIQSFESNGTIWTNLISKLTEVDGEIIIAKSDVESFSQELPNLVAAGEVAADGSIKIHKTAAESIIQDYQAQFDASKATTKGELEDLRAVAQSNAKLAQLKIDHYQEVIDGQKTLADVQKTIADETAKYQVDLDNEVTEHILKNQQTVANAQSASQQIQYWSSRRAVAVPQEIAEIEKELNKWQAILWGEASSSGKLDTSKLSTNLQKDTAIVLQNSAKDELDYWNKQIALLDNEISRIEFGNWSELIKEDAAAAKNLADMIKYIEDIYHDINIEIKKVETNLERLKDAQDELVNDDLLNNLNEQIAANEILIAQEQEKQRIQQRDAATRRAALQQQGVTFAPDGTITNYETILQSAFKNVSEAYNLQAAANDDITKEAYEAEKEIFEQLKQDIEDYDALLFDDMAETVNNITDYARDSLQTKLDKLNVKLDLAIDFHDIESSYNDFLKTWNEDFTKSYKDTIDEAMLEATRDLYDADNSPFAVILSEASNNATILGQALTDLTSNQLSQFGQVVTVGDNEFKIDGERSILDAASATAAQIESSLSEVKAAEGAAWDDQFNAISEFTSRIDQSINEFTKIQDKVEHAKKLMELYGRANYATIDDYYNDLNNQFTDSITVQKATIEELKTTQATYRQLYEDAAATGNEQAAEAQREAIEGIEEELTSATETLMDTYTKQVESSIKEAFDRTNRALMDGLSFDTLDKNWELINQVKDQTLDEVNTAYEIQKLMNKYTDALNSNTGDVRIQEKISKAMQEQYDLLKSKAKLSQYEVDRANALYDITLKQIALEEAQMNKTTMRLRRDSQGNQTYQYVANDSAINKARQELEDAQNNLYNLDLDALNKNQEDALHLVEKYQEEYQKIALDNTLDREDREKQLLDLRQKYDTMFTEIQRQNSVIREGLNQSSLNEIANYNLDIEQNRLIPEWENAIQSMMDKVAADGGLTATQASAMNTCEENTSHFREIAEVEFDKAKTAIGNVVTETDILSGKVKDLKEKYSGTDGKGGLLKSLKDQAEAMQTLVGKYQAAKTELERLIATTQTYQKAQSSKGSKQSGGEGGTINGSNTDMTLETPVETSTESKATKTLALNTSTDLTLGARVHLTGGNGQARRASGEGFTTNPKYPANSGTTFYVTKVVPGAEYPQHISTNTRAVDSDPSNTNGWVGWVKKQWLTAFDTGGYTGAWGSEGRMAMLHQKELVLNAKDTENILGAVTLVRDVAGMLQRMNNSLLSHLVTAPSGGHVASSDMNVNQTVTIAAEFPNVTSHNEIEEALTNLVNAASQRAFDTRR